MIDALEFDKRLATLEIKSLLAEYNVNGDRGRFKEMASVFTVDGVLRGHNTWTGRSEIESGLGKREGGRLNSSEGPDRPFLFVRHHLTTSSIVFESEVRARGRTYFTALTEIGLDHAGIYVDEFRTEKGLWKISKRSVLIDWVADNGHTHLTRKGDSA